MSLFKKNKQDAAGSESASIDTRYFIFSQVASHNKETFDTKPPSKNLATRSRVAHPSNCVKSQAPLQLGTSCPLK